MDDKNVTGSFESQSEKSDASTQTLTKRILCVGTCSLDVVHITPKYPVESSRSFVPEGYWQRGGSAGNICTVLRNLGGKCEFLGILSSVPRFHFIIEDFHNRGISISHCPRVPADPPMRSIILTRDTGTRTIFNSNNSTTIYNFDRFHRLNVIPYKWFHFEALHADETVRMMQLVRAVHQNAEENVRISIYLKEPQHENLSLAEFADYVFVSREFAEMMSSSDMKEALFDLRNRLRPRQELNFKKPAIIYPCGEKGVSFLDECDNYMHAPALEVQKIVDPLGAGDVFCAAFIFGMLTLELKLRNSVAFANRCASYKLGHRGFDALSSFMCCGCQS